MSRYSFDESSSPVLKHGRGLSISLSLPVGDAFLGWPLLNTNIANSTTQKLSHDIARKMSVEKWVMTSLPRRSLSHTEVDSPASRMSEAYVSRKDLELLLMKNSDGFEVFSYGVIKKSTSEFSSGNLIGKGGFNSVYKGILPHGKHVAVKVSRSSKESWKDFIREMEIMTTIKHKRITPLLGVCIGDNELISVYEFLSGSIEENCSLSWKIRFQIAVGIGEALHYLHKECPKPIIHRDVKSSNILLTEELEPQLCDFGLAMWGPTTSSFLMGSDVVGTFGYLAPEYFMYGKISDKIDVYAFGVVLLELLSGRRAIDLETIKGPKSLVMWAKSKLESGDLKSILDPCLVGNVDEAEMQMVGLAAKLCLRQSARLRPGMDRIMRILRGEDEAEDGAMKSECGIYEGGDNDDEVYPSSLVEPHLGVAFLDVHEDSSSFSSLEQNSPFSVEEYLKKRWSRSSSFE